MALAKWRSSFAAKRATRIPGPGPDPTGLGPPQGAAKPGTGRLRGGRLTLSQGIAQEKTSKILSLQNGGDEQLNQAHSLHRFYNNFLTVAKAALSFPGGKIGTT